MIRMPLVGYCFGIRSERAVRVHLNLAYRWFCRLGLDGEVPDHSPSRRTVMAASLRTWNPGRFWGLDGRHWSEQGDIRRPLRRGNSYFKGNSGGRVTFGWNCARQGITSLASHASALRLTSSGK
jgi:hypothetical protein